MFNKSPACGIGVSSSRSVFLCAALTLLLLHTPGAFAEVRYSLNDVLQMAQTQSPIIEAAKAREAAASASIITARTIANPELEFGMGPTRYRTPGGLGNDGNWGTAISQPLEFPGVRQARQAVATSSLKIASLGTELTAIELETRVKSAFYEVLQRQAILLVAQGDRQLLTDIRDRVKLRVDVGESPRYELIKADTEWLAAERDYQTALTQVLEAKAYLRGLVGADMPEDFGLAGEIPLGSRLPPLPDLLAKIPETRQVAQLRGAIEAAEAKVRLQEKLRMPGVTVKAGIEQDPDLRQFRLGIAVPIPVWDQRRGPVLEAAAELSEQNALLRDREQALNRELNAAYQRYTVARQQLDAFENGLLVQAESALKVAEAAYRFGERGILDYLDAQRTYRAVRKDYLSASYGYIDAILQIEQLLGEPIIRDISS